MQAAQKMIQHAALKAHSFFEQLYEEHQKGPECKVDIPFPGR